MADSLHQEFSARPGRGWVYEDNSCLDFFGQPLLAYGDNAALGTHVQVSVGDQLYSLSEVPSGIGEFGPLITLPRPDGLVTLVSPGMLLVLRGKQLVHGYLKWGAYEALHGAGVDGFGTHWVVTNNRVYVCGDPLEQGSPVTVSGSIPWTMYSYTANLTLVLPGYEYYGWPLPNDSEVASATFKLQADGLLKCTYYPPLENGMPDTSDPRAVILTSKGPEVAAA